VPFKSKKQRTYLAINEPEVYKKFKKEEQNMYGKPMKKKSGGKIKKYGKTNKFKKHWTGANVPKLNKSGKAALQMGDTEAILEMKNLARDIVKAKDNKSLDKAINKQRKSLVSFEEMKEKSPEGKKINYKRKINRSMGGKVYKNIVKKPMGGKVYKVDNKGQQLVAKQYGGKIHG
jgi:hypothetical protein